MTNLAPELPVPPSTIPEAPTLTWHVAAPEPPPQRRRNPATIVLAVVVALLVVGVGVLGALVLDARSSADELAVTEAAEDEQQAVALSDAEQQLADARAELTAAQAAAVDAEAAAAQAEADQRNAEQAAAPDDESVEEFLRLLRDSDSVFWTATDTELLEIGTLTCQYFDQFGNSDRVFAELGSVYVQFGLSSSQAAMLTSASVVVFCPQHTLD